MADTTIMWLCGFVTGASVISTIFNIIFIRASRRELRKLEEEARNLQRLN